MILPLELELVGKAVEDWDGSCSWVGTGTIPASCSWRMSSPWEIPCPWALSERAEEEEMPFTVTETVSREPAPLGPSISEVDSVRDVGS